LDCLFLRPHVPASPLEGAILYPAIDRGFIVHPDGSGLRQITHDDAFTGSPSWSADGKSLFCHQASIDELDNIVSARRLRSTTQITRIDMATGGQTVLTGGKGEKWSPQQLADGRIGYVSGGPEGGVEFAGGAPGARGEIRNPHWSPDGRHMVFQRDVDANWPPFKPWPSRDPMIRLVRMGVFPSWSGPLVIENDQTAGVLHNSILSLKPDGTGQKVLFTDADRTALAPVLSRQGDRIAFGLGGFFQMVKGKSVADIAVINTDGTGLLLLTDGSGNVGFPDWSPDGKLIVYRRSTETGSSLFILDIATRTSHLLTSGRHENFPTWSPKGDRIAFTSDRTGDYEIYTIRPDGTGLTQLTHSPGNEGHNSWSPDGEWIAFTSAHEGYKDEALLHPHNPQSYGDIYIMRADGSDMRMLTDDPYEEGTPSWFSVAPAR
jgi:Tol biopolymer transport system component